MPRPFENEGDECWPLNLGLDQTDSRMVVAVQVLSGRGKDWANWKAYLGTNDTGREDEETYRAIASQGSKLPEAVARAIFPGVAEDYRP
jgi:hypothetical protein